MIHERFCSNHGFAAATSLSAGGLAARLAGQLRTFATNRHEECALEPSHDAQLEGPWGSDQHLVRIKVRPEDPVGLVQEIAPP